MVPRVTKSIRSLGIAALLLHAVGSCAFAFCFEEAGSLYGINPLILRAIAKVESNFNPTAIHRNTNGTYDFGLMQINSSWATVLGRERWNLLGDACYNTMTGSWILAACMSKYGYSWKAIGCYNSQTPDKRDRYAQLVFKQLQSIVAGDRAGKKGDGRRAEAPAPFQAAQPELLREPPAVPSAEPAMEGTAGSQAALASLPEDGS